MHVPGAGACPRRSLRKIERAAVVLAMCAVNACAHDVSAKSAETAGLVTLPIAFRGRSSRRSSLRGIL
jgi:hypothetical protein